MKGAYTNSRPGVLRRFLTSALGLGLLSWMVACGGGSSVAPQAVAPPVEVQPGLALRVAAEPAANSLQTVELRVGDAAKLYQLACRIAYSSSAVEPLNVARGTLADDRAAFFSTTTASGYVPVAFSYHPGEAIPSPAGSVAVIEFRVIDATTDPAYRVIEDDEFLLARDSSGQPLAVALGVER